MYVVTPSQTPLTKAFEFIDQQSGIAWYATQEHPGRNYTAGEVRNGARNRHPEERLSWELQDEPFYNDDGCEAAAACLSCRLSQCKYDDPAWFHLGRRMSSETSAGMPRWSGRA